MRNAGLVLVLVFGVMLSGCTVRSYSMTRDRVDQDLDSGNRGYLAGTAPEQNYDRPTTRTTQVVEVELRSPIRFEKGPAVKKVSGRGVSESDTELYGNRGYITRSSSYESESVEPAVVPSPAFEYYKVEKGDTLQKISQKFFGTTKKWPKIYDANKDTLKGPDKVRVGQMLKIPMAGCKSPVLMEEPSGNLK